MNRTIVWRSVRFALPLNLLFTMLALQRRNGMKRLLTLIAVALAAGTLFLRAPRGGEAVPSIAHLP